MGDGDQAVGISGKRSATDADAVDDLYAHLVRAASGRAGAKIRKTISKETDVSEKSIRQFIADKSALLRANRKTISSLLSWHRESSFVPTMYTNLLMSILTCMGIDSQGDIEKYTGSYHAFRFTNRHAGFVEGRVTVNHSHPDQCWMHCHTSVQAINGKLVQFSHRGPVIAIGNRVYFIGIGSDDASGRKYIRVMILRNVDDPKRQAISGMILTERAEDNTPISTKIVLYHNDLVGNTNDFADRHRDEMKRILSNECSSEDILCGWGI